MNPSIAIHPTDSSSLRWGLGDIAGLGEAVTRPAIRLTGSVPSWATPVVDRIAELAAKPTVDPAGSRPLNIDDVFDALRFLLQVMRDDTSPPWVGRLNSGGLQLTWRGDNVEVEAVFDRARAERAVIVAVGDNEWDAPAEEAGTLFEGVVDRLSSSHLERVTAP